MQGSPAIDMTSEGSVVASSGGNVKIDPCNGMPGCTKSPTTLTVTAPDLPATFVAQGALVRLHYETSFVVGGDGAPGSYEAVWIENLDSLDGVSNPVDTRDKVWFAGLTANGTLAYPAFPFSISGTPECEGTCSNDTVYSMHVAFGGAVVDIPQGKSVDFSVALDRAANYTLENLANHANCDVIGQADFWLVSK